MPWKSNLEINVTSLYHQVMTSLKGCYRLTVTCCVSIVVLPHGGTSTAAAVGAGGYEGGSGPPCANGVSTVLMDNAKWVGSRSNGLGCGGTPESTNISQFRFMLYIESLYTFKYFNCK